MGVTMIEARSPPISPNLPSDLDTRQLSIVLTCAITPLFSIIFVGLRFYARRPTTRHLQIEDWITAGTLILCLAYSVLLALWTVNGGGMREADIARLSMFDDYYRWIMISSPVYLLACMGYKVAILILYLRLFTQQRKIIYATWVLLIITIIYLGCNILTQIFGCRPISLFWDKATPNANGSCIDFVAADVSYGSLTIVTDLLIFVLPTSAVWKSLLDRHEKVGVSLVFLSGAIALTAALVRFGYAVAKLSAPDQTYLTGMEMLWMVLEINTGLICSCTPTLKPLYYRLFASEAPDRFQSSQHRRRRSTGTVTGTVFMKGFRRPAHGPSGMPTVDEDERAAARRAARGSGGAGGSASRSRAGSMASSSRIRRTSVVINKRVSSILTPFKSPWLAKDPMRAKLFGFRSPGSGITKRGLAEGYDDKDRDAMEPLTPGTPTVPDMKQMMAAAMNKMNNEGDDRSSDDDGIDDEANGRPRLEVLTDARQQGRARAGSTDTASKKSKKQVRFGGDGSWFLTSPVDDEEEKRKSGRFQLKRPPAAKKR